MLVPVVGVSKRGSDVSFVCRFIVKKRTQHIVVDVVVVRVVVVSKQ